MFRSGSIIDATDLFNNPLVIPGGHDVLHVEVGGEEADDAVGNDGNGLGQQGAVVSGTKKQRIIRQEKEKFDPGVPRHFFYWRKGLFTRPFSEANFAFG